MGKEKDDRLVLDVSPSRLTHVFRISQGRCQKNGGLLFEIDQANTILHGFQLPAHHGDFERRQF